ncbi:MAG: DUF420 domain-containing protein [Nitrospinota bacterium]|nr:DUF420 domain-containing protein [Nitrospinota bacterium]
MQEFLKKPGFMVQSGTMGADLSYLLAVIFTVLFLLAWWMAKKGQGTRHHNLIFVSMVSMVVYFVAYYYARSLGVLSLEGKEGFGGPPEVYDSVFMPVLTTHLILVTLGLILTPYMIVEGFRACDKVGGDYVLRPGDLKADPKKFKRIWIWILALWALMEVYCLAMGKSGAAQLAYLLIFATIAGVVGLEKLIEKWLTDGARRHRVLGRITMVMFALILVTSTATYLMLYVIYPVKTVAGS